MLLCCLWIKVFVNEMGPEMRTIFIMFYGTINDTPRTDYNYNTNLPLILVTVIIY